MSREQLLQNREHIMHFVGEYDEENFKYQRLKGKNPKGIGSSLFRFYEDKEYFRSSPAFFILVAAWVLIPLYFSLQAHSFLGGVFTFIFAALINSFFVYVISKITSRIHFGMIKNKVIKDRDKAYEEFLENEKVNLEYLQQLHDEIIQYCNFPPKYWNKFSMHKMFTYLINYQAENEKECIQLFEAEERENERQKIAQQQLKTQEDFRKKQLASIEEQNRLIRENTRRTEELRYEIEDLRNRD